MQYFGEIVTDDPSIYSMDHPDFIVAVLWKFHWSEKGQSACNKYKNLM